MSLQYIQKVEDFIIKSNKKPFPVLSDEINDLEKKIKLLFQNLTKNFCLLQGSTLLLGT